MALTQLAAQFNTLSLAMKLGMGVAVLVLILIVGGVTRSCVSSYKDAAADKKQAELKAESDAHRKRADEAEARAKEFEAQAKIQEMVVQAAGAKVEAIAEKVKVEDAKFIEEMRSIGGSVADPCERVRRVCLRLAIKPADCTCTSN